ncbi:MAG: hypothetical protein AB1Z65_14410, partial [Candidatus Sulfomarinibacteraceae bacterium]
MLRVIAALSCAAVPQVLPAADSDLSTTTEGPWFLTTETPFTVVVGYANAGPDTAGSAYPNHYFVPPVGLDVFVDDTVNGNGAMFTALQASAEGTDTLGNAPLLFFDDNYCEEVLFQVQQQTLYYAAFPGTGRLFRRGLARDAGARCLLATGRIPE